MVDSRSSSASEGCSLSLAQLTRRLLWPLEQQEHGTGFGKGSVHCVKAELKPRQGSQPQNHADTFLSFSSVPLAKRFIALVHVICSGCAPPRMEPKALRGST